MKLDANVGCPNPAAFKEAGFTVATYLEIERRWNWLEKDERLAVLKHIYPLAEKPLEELLK